MLLHVLILASDHSTGLNVGALLSGLAAMTVAVGSGIGAFVRYRKAAKAIKLQASQRTVKEVQEAADRLAEQYEARIEQNEETIERLNDASTAQHILYEERLANQQALINTLLVQILKHRK